MRYSDKGVHACTHPPFVCVLAHPSRNQRLIYSSICRHSFISIPVHPYIDLSSIDLWIQRIYPTIPISLPVKLSVYPSFRQTISRSVSLSIYPSHYLSRYSLLSAQRLVHRYQKKDMFWHATSLLQDLDILGNVRADPGSKHHTFACHLQVTIVTHRIISLNRGIICYQASWNGAVQAHLSWPLGLLSLLLLLNVAAPIAKSKAQFNFKKPKYPKYHGCSIHGARGYDSMLNMDKY